MSLDPYRNPANEVPYNNQRDYGPPAKTPDDRLPDGDTVHIPGYPDYRDSLDKPQPRPRDLRWVATLFICALIIAAVLIGGAR